MRVGRQPRVRSNEVVPDEAVEDADLDRRGREIRQGASESVAERQLSNVHALNLPRARQGSGGAWHRHL